MRGIDRFREFFAGHRDEYVLIGGGACNLLIGEVGQNFRATKDLDLVLLVEALTAEFERDFWNFVRGAGARTSRRAAESRNSTAYRSPRTRPFPP